jgi:hypothetical protein
VRTSTRHGRCCGTYQPWISNPRRRSAKARRELCTPKLAAIYRPGGDDPRPYREPLDRLGNGGQLPALKWLAGHDCAVGAEWTEAETLVRAYQDSPDRAAMLDTLAHLRRQTE